MLSSTSFCVCHIYDWPRILHLVVSSLWLECHPVCAVTHYLWQPACEPWAPNVTTTDQHTVYTITSLSRLQFRWRSLIDVCFPPEIVGVLNICEWEIKGAFYQHLTKLTDEFCLLPSHLLCFSASCSMPCLSQSSTLKMKARRAFNMSVDFHRYTCRYIPKVVTLHNHRCENTGA